MEKHYHLKFMANTCSNEAPEVLVLIKLLDELRSEQKVDYTALPTSGASHLSTDGYVLGYGVRQMPERLEALGLIDAKQRVETEKQMRNAREQYERALEREMRAPHERALESVRNFIMDNSVV